jgi:Transcription factor IIIC subunit delta N-term
MSDQLEGLEVTGRIKRQNCLAWSQDGELAIATGSIVHIRVCILMYPVDLKLTPS